MGAQLLVKEARFAAGLARRRPFNCLLQVTNRCNMRCGFCGFWSQGARPTEELSLAEIERVAAGLTRLGCFLVSIEGGEPFVRSDLVDIVRVLSRKHVTALFTNGWHVTAENARAIFDAGLTHASVSIDYAEAERHDGRRGVEGAHERAWRAVRLLRAVAPGGGRQVNVMTVVMRDNADGLETLVEQTARAGVGHYFTLLSTSGIHRGSGTECLPLPGISATLTRLWDQHPHVRFFRSYLEGMDRFVEGRDLPTCRAGEQSFNIDHRGHVSACIERIDEPVGNVRDTSLPALHRRLRARVDGLAGCQQCWTACRGMHQTMGRGGTLRGWLDLARRA